MKNATNQAFSEAKNIAKHENSTTLSESTRENSAFSSGVNHAENSAALSKKELSELVVQCNDTLECAEDALVRVRLGLLSNAVRVELGSDFRVLVCDDEIHAVPKNCGEVPNFGFLIGFFDECWWCGVVLFNAKVSSDGLLKSVSEHFRKGKNEHKFTHELEFGVENFVYVANAAIVESWDFAEFLPKMLDNLSTNKALVLGLKELFEGFNA